MGWDRLCVIWREPQSGRRYNIGELWKTHEGYAFGYDLEGAKSCSKACGFDLLPEFPDVGRTIDNPYQATYLFPTFSQRIPSRKRPDFDKLMRLWGVESSDDDLEILGVSGGMQATDRLELSDYRMVGDDLTRPLFFRLAGMQYFLDSESVQIGECLHLRRDFKNSIDSQATKIENSSGIQVGWVPRQYSALVANLIEKGVDLELVTLRHLPLLSEQDRWLLRLSRKDA